MPVTFPMDILEKGLAANNFGMLGLGDIVVPGICLDIHVCVYTHNYGV